MRTKTRRMFTSTLLALAAAAGLPMMAHATVVETIDLVAANGGNPIVSQGANNSTTQPNASVSVTPTSNANIKAVLFTGTVTKVASGTFASEARIAMRLPGTSTDILLQPMQRTSFTTTEDIIQWRALIPAGVVANTGAWSFRFYESFVDSTTTPDSDWTALSVSFDDALTPPATDIGTLSGANNPIVANGAVAANQVTWYQFTTTGSTTPNYIDMHTLGSSLAPNNNTAIAVYNAATGVRVGHSDDYQATINLLSGLAYNSVATTPRTYSPWTTTFTNGAGNLAAGTYLVGVYAGPSGTAWSATVTFAQAGVANISGFNIGAETPFIAAADAGPATLNLITNGAPTPPSGTVAYAPRAALFQGETLTLTMTVVPGTLPTSTGITVTSALGTWINSGGNVWTLTTGPLGAPFGALTDTITIADAQGRSTITTASYTVNPLTSLGTISGANPVLTANQDMAAGQIVWYSFTLAQAADATRFLDMTTYLSTMTDGGTTGLGNDTELGLYDPATGTLLATNDDSGTGGTPNNYLSLLSYGQAAPSRTYLCPATNSLQTATGQTGATLAAGTYYLAVAGFNSNFTSPFGVTSTSTYTGPMVLKILTNTNLPTNPTGSFSAAPNSVLEGFGQTTVISVVTTPGTNPTSSAITVTADLTAIGGLASTPLVEGPAGTFTLSYPVPVSVTAGVKSIPFTVSDPDLGGRSSNGTGTISVLPVIDLGTLTSAGIVNTDGTIVANGIAWYKVVLPECDADIFVDMTTVGSSFAGSSDSEIGVYDSTGALMGSDDDFGGSLFSAVSFGGTAAAGRNYPPFTVDCTGQTAGSLAAGTYYIAIGRYNVNFNPNFSVTSTGGAAGTITLNLYNNSSAGPAGCNLADITGIGGPPAIPDGLLTGDDFNAFVSAFANNDLLADVTGIGGPPALPDGLITGDDFNAFIAAFANGCP